MSQYCSARAAFRDFTVAFDVASMAVIRLRGLLEVEEFARYADAVDTTDVKGLTAVRNFVAHGGYVHGNADMLWAAVTEYLPRVVAVLRDSAGAEGPSHSPVR